MKRVFLTLLLCLFSVGAFAQGTVMKWRYVTSLPSTCTTGSSAHGMDVTVSTGTLYFCTATNTWTAVGNVTLIGAGSTGISLFNAGTDTTASRSDHTHRAFGSVTWFFPGTPATGVQNLTLTVPNGVTNAVITDMIVTANTPGSTTSTINVQRCTTACAGNAPTFANIYATGLVLPVASATVGRTASCTGLGTCGTLTTTINAGDQFKVNLSALGTSVSDITVQLIFKNETTN